MTAIITDYSVVERIAPLTIEREPKCEPCGSIMVCVDADNHGTDRVELRWVCPNECPGDAVITVESIHERRPNGEKEPRPAGLPALPEWTPADCAAACDEGWCVFNVDGGGPLEIERDDEAEVFESDDEAIAHVRRRAKAGSELHQKAITLHDAHNPEDDDSEEIERYWTAREQRIA